MRNGEPGWFASLLGAAVLIAGGFALGLVAGVVSEEPELVVGHLVGRSDEVAWAPEGDPEFTPSEEAAPLAPLVTGDDEGRELAAVELTGVPVDEDGLVPARRESQAERGLQQERAVEPPLPAVAAAPPQRERAPLRDVSSLPETSSPAQRAASSGSEPVSGFAVQVGAFSDGDAANQVRRKLEGKGFDSYVVPSSVSGDGKWRVRVGPVPSRAAADALAGRLKSEERLPTWVLSEGGG